MWKYSEKTFPSKQVKRYFHGMSTEDYNEDAALEDVDKFIANEGNEAHKQLSIIDLLNPILQNPEKHHIEQDVTLDPEALKNELAEEAPTTEFEDQMLEASDTFIAGEEPAMHQFFIY